jgi:hypothetical protein
MSSIITRMQNVVKAGLMPYWDMDPEDADAGDGKLGPFMNVEALYHNSDKSMDMVVETSQGKSEYKDYPLSLDWSNRLRNLKFTSTIKRLIDNGILSKEFNKLTYQLESGRISTPNYFPGQWPTF